MNNSERNWRHGRLLRYVPLILCCAIILVLSTSEGSAARTSLFVRPVLRFLFPATPENTLAIYHFYIRKSAHLIEYTLLGVAAAHAFRYSSRAFLSRYWFVGALLVALSVASVDEAWQSLNPSRTGSPSDVVLDLCGGLIGVGIFGFIISIWNKHMK